MDPKVLFLLVLCRSAVGIRINFTTCQNPEWSCVNNAPNEIVYTCSLVRSNVSIAMFLFIFIPL